MTTTASSQTVVLRGGLTVDVAALRLLWSLEDRGVDVRLAADGALLVGPRAALTDTDRAAIREHRNILEWLVRYCERVSEEVS